MNYSPSASNATIDGAVLRFTFSGKEKDLETGLSYFGARYYDADLTTGWLSVDPMADKYPSMSPYNYCAGNPVKLVDPDGEEYTDFFDNKGNFLGTDGVNNGQVYILKQKYRAKIENVNVNWGGLLEPKHIEQLINHSEKISMDSDVGMLSRLLYAEFRGQSDAERKVCADIVMNRVDHKSYPNTIAGVITEKNQFSSLNKGDINRKYYEDPSNTLNNSSNVRAWRNCVSIAISAYNGYSRGISLGATLYFSPRSMIPKGSFPKWDFSILQEVYPKNVDPMSMRCFKSKK